MKNIEVSQVKKSTVIISGLFVFFFFFMLLRLLQSAGVPVSSSLNVILCSLLTLGIAVSLNSRRGTQDDL